VVRKLGVARSPSSIIQNTAALTRRIVMAREQLLTVGHSASVVVFVQGLVSEIPHAILTLLVYPKALLTYLLSPVARMWELRGPGATVVTQVSPQATMSEVTNPTATIREIEPTTTLPGELTILAYPVATIELSSNEPIATVVTKE
jgi:hypothetical protein